MTHPTDLPRFCGWHRPMPAAAWQRVVEAESEAECRELLAVQVEGGQVAVTELGRHPDSAEAFSVR